MLRLQELGFLLAACPTDPAREKKSSLNPLALTFMSRVREFVLQGGTPECPDAENHS